MKWNVADYLDNNGNRFLAVWEQEIKSGEKGSPICLITPKGTETEKDLLTAKLIAAAPDLLEACIALVKRNKQLYAMVEYPCEDMIGEISLAKGKEAIKKATE